MTKDMPSGQEPLTHFPIYGAAGCLIGSVDEWFQHAPPKQGSRHWKDGRSAKELAKAWFRTGTCAVPHELRELLSGNDHLRDCELSKGYAEHVTALDHFPGEGRNHDLLLIGRCGAKPIVIGVEAKADESFGATVADTIAACRQRQRSNGVRRVENILQGLFGASETRQLELERLRYQLLTATAGTLIEARKHDATMAVVIVHVFRSRLTTADNVQRNDRDYAAFVKALEPRSSCEAMDGHLYGPFQTNGGEHVPSEVRFWIGKVSHELTA